MERGNLSRKFRIRSASNRKFGGSCQSSGPSLRPSASTPLARKFGTVCSASVSRFMWVMKRAPLTAKQKSDGVSATQR